MSKVVATPFAEPILHVDMDAFFVEVERLEDPSLRGFPVVVGGTGNRAVVASASYEARRFGIASAMPMARARRLCPELQVVPPRHRLYEEVSDLVFDIFRSFTPMVEGVSLDEAFLDVSGLRLHFSDSVNVGEAVRRRLRAELDLPASVGVAATKLVAKLASEWAKPDGLKHVPASEEVRFLHALPVRALPGVGEATHAALERLGAKTVADLATIPESTLGDRLGAAMAAHLRGLAFGRDDRPVVPDREAKSMSVEETYETDLTSRGVVTTELLRLADRLAGRLRRAGVGGRTITLKVRFPDFTTVTRSRTLPELTVSAHHIYAVVVELLDELAIGRRRVRLLGIELSHLQGADDPRQLRVGDDDRWDEIESAVASVRARYGPKIVGAARLHIDRSPRSH